MDIRSLRYFVETVRINSFTRAAENLHVTQSTVSKMVHQLEKEVGAPLLIREGRRLELTDIGRVVFERGQEMLLSMQQLTREVRDIQALRQGSLTVGIPPMINLLFTPVLKTFRERHPDISLQLQEDTGQEIERQVASGQLEVGLTVMPVDPQLKLTSVPIASYPVWALAQAGSFGKRTSTLRLKTLHGVPLVMLKDDFALTRRLRRAFAEAGFEPRIAAQSGQWDWLIAMASAGLGVTLLPEPFVHRLASERLEGVRIVEPEISWEVAHIRSGRYLSHAATAWIEVCREVLGTSERSGMQK